MKRSYGCCFRHRRCRLLLPFVAICHSRTVSSLFGAFWHTLLQKMCSSKQWRRNELEIAGHTSGPKHFFAMPFTFLALKVQLVVLVSAFVMVSTIWSVSCLLFFYSRCTGTQPFVKVGTCRPPAALWSRRHCF